MKAAIRLRGAAAGRAVVLEVAAEEVVLGSGDECGLVVADATVSRRHAALRCVEGELEVRDLGSTNGTWVGGRRVDRVRLAPGAEVLFGRLRFAVEALAAGDRELALALPLPDAGAVAASGGAPAAAPSGARGSAPAPPPALAGAAAPRPARVEATLGLGPLDLVATQLLPRLLEQLADGLGPADLAIWLGSVAMPLLSLDRLEIADERGGVLFRAEARDAAPRAELVTRQAGRYRATAAFAQPERAQALGSLVEALALAVALADQRWRGPLRPAAAAAPPDPAPPGPPTLDPAMREVYRRAERVAPGAVGVLVLGESGTGKELLAQHLHRLSGRERFVALNCAALPRDLLEAELFGIEKGTATGVEARPGKLELADGGTLFLDEVGDMSLETQAKILRVLQEGEVYRLGSAQPRPARARVVAATNKDVARMVEAEEFRLDLYHRIAGWVVELPPLRERRADIPGLAGHFLAAEGEALGRRFRGISQAALDALVAYAWPGNVRQLQQTIARCALFLDDGGVLEASLLDPAVRSAGAPAPATLATRLEAFERGEIERALAAAGGQVAEAAQRLGVHRATLYRRMKALGLDGG